MLHDLNLIYMIQHHLLGENTSNGSKLSKLKGGLAEGLTAYSSRLVLIYLNVNNYGTPD